VTVTPREAVDTANKLFGSHPHARALHAKGILCKGTFTSTPEAAELTTAAHMQGVTVPATYRLSNGAGSPHHADYKPDPRGLAAKFYLPDDSRTDIVAVTTPIFPVSTPEAFVALMRVQAAGPLGALKLPQLLARNPSIMRNGPAGLKSLRPPAGYSTARYYGMHAFKWIGPDGTGRYVRYYLIPEDAEAHLSVPAARKLGRNYLIDGVAERLSRGPIRFTLELQIADPGDTTNDPSRAWPSSRRRVKVGSYEMTELETGRETGGDVLVFDPTRVTDGIELSEDPILRFRHDAYSESVARRMAS
jgi:catalase